VEVVGGGGERVEGGELGRGWGGRVEGEEWGWGVKGLEGGIVGSGIGGIRLRREGVGGWGRGGVGVGQGKGGVTGGVVMGKKGEG